MNKNDYFIKETDNFGYILLYEQFIHLTQIILGPSNRQHAYQLFLSHFLVLFHLQYCGILDEFMMKMLTRKRTKAIKLQYIKV